MFDKFMGGQLVQMVEYRQGDLLYRAKKATPIGPDQALRVAGLNGKKTKVVAAVTCARPLEGGDFLCVAQVHDLAQQRELSKLCPASANPDSKLRQHPRNERKVEITCNDRAATSIAWAPSSNTLEDLHTHHPHTHPPVSDVVFKYQELATRFIWHRREGSTTHLPQRFTAG